MKHNTHELWAVTHSLSTTRAKFKTRGKRGHNNSATGCWVGGSLEPNPTLPHPTSRPKSPECLRRHSNVYSTTEVSPTLNHGCRVQEQVSVTITLLPRVQEIIRQAS